MIDQLYCCKCERTTTHELVDDEIFGKGWECLVCHTIWEAEHEAPVVEIKTGFDRQVAIDKYGDKDDI